ncbi:MAG: sulfatase-like hydrolase/transferase, partial [Verrucomicrobiales bacterium]|nr:sulfatase-like hydrolase/transferase [Verrucomicrobiales bacterium]
MHALSRFILFLVLLAGLQSASAQPPNILLLLADDMGWGDLGCHGNDKLDTPSLDTLQGQSVSLEQFYVSPVCAPTRASLL